LTWIPENAEIATLDLITGIKILHFEGTRLLTFDSVDYYSHGCGVIVMYRDWWLEMAHLGQDELHNPAFLMFMMSTPNSASAADKETNLRKVLSENIAPLSWMDDYLGGLIQWENGPMLCSLRLVHTSMMHQNGCLISYLMHNIGGWLPDSMQDSEGAV
jgi:hypothetical protein